MIKLVRKEEKMIKQEGNRQLSEEKKNCGSQIRRFYAGKQILLTGCTGYLGTIILEKTLRTCTEISKIYVMIREKKNMEVKERLEKCFANNVSRVTEIQYQRTTKIYMTLDGDNNIEENHLTFVKKK